MYLKGYTNTQIALNTRFSSSYISSLIKKHIVEGCEIKKVVNTNIRNSKYSNEIIKYIQTTLEDIVTRDYSLQQRCNLVEKKFNHITNMPQSSMHRILISLG
jgi:hypothetical protein